jgi:uncharacterized protein YhbP (UPF0306 family)
LNRNPEQLARTYVRNHQVMTLATAGPQGVWAAAVFYASDGFDLYFLSASHTRHGQNMAAQPHVAATIQEDYPGWEEIRGIQLEGEVQRLQAEARRHARELYEEKYPFVKNAGAPLQAALAHVEWYQLRPERLYFIDNSEGLGHRDRVI